MKNPRLNHVLPARNSCHWQRHGLIVKGQTVTLEASTSLSVRKQEELHSYGTNQTSRQNYLVETKNVYLKEKYVVIECCAIWLYEINTRDIKGKIGHYHRRGDFRTPFSLISRLSGSKKSTSEILIAYLWLSHPECT